MTDPMKPAEIYLNLEMKTIAQIKRISKSNSIDITPIRVRIVRAIVKNVEYFFATTLTDLEITPKKNCSQVNFKHALFTVGSLFPFLIGRNKSKIKAIVFILMKQLCLQFVKIRLNRKYPRLRKRPHLGFQTSGKRFQVALST